MSVKGTQEDDVYLSPGDLIRYRQMYDNFMSYYAGLHITFEEFIRRHSKHDRFKED